MKASGYLGSVFGQLNNDLSRNPCEDVGLSHQKSAEVIVVRMTTGRRTEQRVKTMKQKIVGSGRVAEADSEDYPAHEGSTVRKTGGN